MKTNVSWEETQELIKKISYDIRDKQQVHVIVAISRGGLVPSRYFANYLGVRNIYSLGIEFYTGTDSKGKVPIIYQTFTNKFKQDSNILIVDDIADSGTTFDVAIDEVMKNGGKNILTCALHYKPRAKHKPDFIGEEVDNDNWICYQWE